MTSAARELPSCVVLGGGGHARVVLDSLQLAGIAVPRAILDANRALWGTEIMGVPVRGSDDLLPALINEGITAFIVGLGGAGDNGPRQRLFDHAVSLGARPLTVVHPSAIVSAWCQIGPGCVLCPLAVVNAQASLGRNVIVNSGAIVEHDCHVGDHVHVATGARLTSGVSVGAGAHIGAGAVVRQGAVIGEHAIVGAGAVVTRDVRPGVTVGGVPAVPLAIKKMP